MKYLLISNITRMLLREQKFSKKYTGWLQNREPVWHRLPAFVGQERSTLNKKDVIDFFNEQASCWDEQMIRYDDVIHQILDNAQVTEGKHILDVACGTGVLIPDYLERKVESVKAIDISSQMIKIAKSKFTQENVEIICGDVETAEFTDKFDCIVVYNAFPHFGDPKLLIERLLGMLGDEGTLTIAHGMSRERINQCHAGKAKNVSLGLIDIEELEKIFPSQLEIIVKISDERMYQIVGKKKA